MLGMQIIVVFPGVLTMPSNILQLFSLINVNHYACPRAKLMTCIQMLLLMLQKKVKVAGDFNLAWVQNTDFEHDWFY